MLCDFGWKSVQLLPVFLGTFAAEDHQPPYKKPSYLEATTWRYQVEKPYVKRSDDQPATPVVWHSLFESFKLLKCWSLQDNPIPDTRHCATTAWETQVRGELTEPTEVLDSWTNKWCCCFRPLSWAATQQRIVRTRTIKYWELFFL